MVEDHEGTRVMNTEALEAAGIEVRAFESSAPALEAIRRRIPDAVLTDIQLRGDHGVQFADAVRGVPGGDSLPIIALTGSVTRSRELDRAFDAVLLKPFEPTKLADEIRKIAARRASAGR
jgi:CheY-like chemotaxis protein